MWPAKILEIEKIFSQINLQKAQVIALLGPARASGVTSLAITLTKRAALQNEKTLLVDFNLLDPDSSRLLGVAPVTTQVGLLELPLVIQKTDCENIYILPAISCQELLFTLRDRQQLSILWAQLKKQFTRIFIDCPALNCLNQHIIPSENIAASSDYKLLLVLGSRTTEAMLINAIQQLKAAGVSLNTIAINDQYCESMDVQWQNYLAKFARIAPKSTNWLSQKIKQNTWLSSEL